MKSMWLGGLSALLCGLLVPKSFAYTAVDYTNAGNQLSAQKNYAQAQQYYQAAVQMDPSQIAAYVGLGNCSYAQGQTQQALTYYEKALALDPSNSSLGQFVQNLQARSGSSAPSGPPSIPGSGTATDPYAQGMALFQQQQYSAAIPFFQQAAQANPNNAQAFYYLGYCQYMTGDKRGAALNFALCNQKNPNPQTQAYAQSLRASLDPDDEEWVDDQLKNSGAPAVPGSSSFIPGFGLRLEPSLQFVAMTWFNNEAKSDQAEFGSGFSASVPSAGIGIELNPYYRFADTMELGLTFDYLVLGNVDIQESGEGSETTSFTILEPGVNFRYYFYKMEKEKIRFFADLNPAFYLITLSSPGSSDTASGSAIGGRIKVGADCELAKDVTASLYVGYQSASASNFKDNSGDNLSTGPDPLAVDLSGLLVGGGIGADF